MNAWCPHCRRRTRVDSQGRCSFIDCDQIVLGGRRIKIKYAGAGAKLITMPVLRRGYALYLEGLSLNRVGEEIWRDTKYASARSCANCISAQWARQGWPLRDRLAASTAASYKHGMAPRDVTKRSKALRSMQRRARGEIRDVQCAGVKDRPGKGRGERCLLAAMRDSEYCRQHDPRFAEARALELAGIRSRRRVESSRQQPGR